MLDLLINGLHTIYQKMAIIVTILNKSVYFPLVYYTPDTFYYYLNAKNHFLEFIMKYSCGQNF